MSICYNIPVRLIESFRDESVVVRSYEVSDLLEAAKKIIPDNLCYLQLLSPQDDSSAFLKLKEPTLIDLVVDDPQEFSLLYKHVELYRSHPVRVTVTATPGFSKAVRLAMSLGLPVKLDVVQPDRSAVNELLELLDHYLHHTTVSQTMDFFHGLLMAFYLRGTSTLWEIQEEDPGMFRYVTDAGEMVISRRLPTTIVPVSADRFLTDLKTKLLDQSECSDCPFFTNCTGYFKLPNTNYRCSDMRELLTVIKNAASELRRDYEECLRAEGGPLT
jgi:hypothetical protein